MAGMNTKALTLTRDELITQYYKALTVAAMNRLAQAIADEACERDEESDDQCVIGRVLPFKRIST